MVGMPRRTTDFRGLAEPSRVRLLREVQAAPGSTLKVLATRAGLHVNTAREHLRTLEQEGLVSAESAQVGRRGRPPIVYTPVNDSNLNPAARRRIEQARENGDLLRRLFPSRRPSSALGNLATHQLDLLYEHLDDAGLDPVVDEQDLHIRLAPCPYHRIVDQDRELACAAHAQLLRDTLAQVPGPLQLEELKPFVSPQACLVRLTRGAADDEPSRRDRSSESARLDTGR